MLSLEDSLPVTNEACLPLDTDSIAPSIGLSTGFQADPNKPIPPAIAQGTSFGNIPWKCSIDKTKLKLLNVGGCSKEIPLPSMFEGYNHVLLDKFVLREEPDILMDATKIVEREDLKEQFDVVYCSHMLEHLPRQDTGAVFRGLFHCLKQDGFLMIRVPDVVAAILDMKEKNRQFHQQPFPTADEAINRAVTYHGIIYGEDFLTKDNVYQTHRQAFTLESLTWALDYVGFKTFHGKSDNLEIILVAFKQEPTTYQMELLYGS